MRGRIVRTTCLRAIAIAILASVLAAVWVAPAMAEPPQTMGLAELQAKLEVDGFVDGYFETVLKGSAITRIDVEISAIASDDSSYITNSSRALIMLEAKGPEIDRLGGLAAGMSGSPVYIDDGTERIVGAIAYGDAFSLNGFGLATPIEAMLAIENYEADFSVGSLSKPVAMGEEVVNKVVISSDPSASKALDTKGTFVAKPYATLSIGAVPPGSRTYQIMSKVAQRHGYDVVPLVSTLGGSKDSFSVPLEPGAAMGALFARGDVWFGGIGTTTYVNDDKVVGFGHPFDLNGESSFQLTNAWIDGTVPNSEQAYKMGRPGALRGTITQDRSAGILGRDGLMPEETTITATVHDAKSGQTSTKVSYTPAAMVDSWWYSDVPAMTASAAAMDATDDWSYIGSADTTTTLVVSDGVKLYTLTRANTFDDEYDISWSLSEDLWSMTYEFTDLSRNGLAHPKIISADFEATVFPQRNTSRIVDVSAPNGLKAGAANRLQISLLQHGVADTVTVDATLTIPAGRPVTGYLEVYPAAYYDDYYDEYYYYEDEFGDAWYDYEYGSVDRRSVADAAEDIGAWTTNRDYTIVFRPRNATTYRSYPSVTSTDSVRTVMTGHVDKQVTNMVASASPTVVGYKTGTRVTGYLDGMWGSPKLQIYRRYSGETADTLVATISTRRVRYGRADFAATVPGLAKNATITVVYPGNPSYMSSSKTLGVKVRAGVKLAVSDASVKQGTSLTLTAKVTPSTAPGSVVFEYRRNGGSWRRISTVSLVGGKASAKWRPGGTSTVRARYVPSAGALNVSGWSSGKTVSTY